MSNPTHRAGVFETAINDKGQTVHLTPEQLGPGQIAGDAEEAKFARQVYITLSDKLAGMNSMWMRGDVARLKDEVRQYRGGELDEAKAKMKAAIKRHEDALKEKTGFKVDPAFRALVSGSFQQMTPAQRAQALDALYAEGNGGALAILDELSPVFTGIAPEQRAVIRERLFSKADPIAFAALKAAQANVGKIDNAMNVMAATMHKFGSGPDVAAPPPAEEARSVATGFAA